jgi:YidC/Oxa1 family membrane protein insertase
MLMATEWYNGQKADRVDGPWFANKTLGCFAGTPRFEYLSGASNVAWASVQNQFFTLIAAPASNAPAWQVLVRHINLPAPTPEELAADPKAVVRPFGFQTAFLYPEVTLAAGQVVERRYDVFAGPKEYKILDRLAARFGNNMDLVMGFGGFFGFFAKALLLSMNGLHNLFHLSYALCIIVITIIIKLVFWPLTNASTRSMKRMAALQPQMKVLQEKYKDDPRKMQQKMSEFWKEHKVNPAAGCLPILIQLPIFIGFYRMLQSAIELRGASFLWAHDLSQADTVWIIPGLNFPLNPLPLIYGVTLIWQARLMPPSPGMDPAQQQIMKYMPVVILFVLYYMPAGLTLYWTVQNLLTIAQTKLTKANEPATAAKGAPPPRAAPPARPARKKNN